MTEAYYDQLAEDYDTFAERLVQLGGKAPPSLAASLKASGVQETDKTSFTCEEVLQLVQKDFTYLAAEYKTARKAAAAEGDSTTEALYVDAIGRLEKQLWMLDATLG
jgi:starvation-inducible DNA-binding protein